MDDFPQKVILKMLNSGDCISFSDLFSEIVEISKVQDFGNFEFSPMIIYNACHNKIAYGKILLYSYKKKTHNFKEVLCHNTNIQIW